MDAIANKFDYEQLGDVAQVVRGLTSRIHARVKRAVEDVIEVGTCLAETKGFLKHGLWGDWLQAEFRWSDETASNYINVAKRHSQIPNYLEFAPTVLYELCRPNTPPEVIAAASEMQASGKPVTVAVAKQLISESREVEDEASDDDLIDDEWEAVDEKPASVPSIVKPTKRCEPDEDDDCGTQGGEIFLQPQEQHDSTDDESELIEFRDRVVTKHKGRPYVFDLRQKLNESLEYLRRVEGRA